MFAVWVKPLWLYRQERLPAALFLALALFLWCAGVALNPPAEIINHIAGILLAWTLVFQFRLWDDLASLKHDQHEHPQRVLCQVSDRRPFWFLLWGLLVINLALLSVSIGIWQAAGLLGLVLIFAAWYQLQQSLNFGKLANAQVILLKYPAFVVLLGAWHGDRLLPGTMILVLLYSCFCIYEILHDQSFWTVSGIGSVLIAEMILMVAALSLMVILDESPGQIVLLLLTTVTIAGLAWLYCCWRSRSPADSRNYCVFLLTLVSIVVFAGAIK